MGEQSAQPRRPACPICGKPSAPETRPFCSTRCADVDLGRWLNERYVIPGPDDPDERQDGEDASTPRN